MLQRRIEEFKIYFYLYNSSHLRPCFENRNERSDFGTKLLHYCVLVLKIETSLRAVDRNCRIKRVERTGAIKSALHITDLKNHVENSGMRVIQFEFVVGSGKTYLLAIRFLACLFIILVSLKNDMRPIGWSQPP